MSSAGPDSQTSTLLDLIGLIYDAVPDQSRWPAFLEALAQATHCTRATLILNTSGERWAIVSYHGWQDHEIHHYHENHAARDPWGLASMAVPEGEVRASHELCSQEELEQSAAYRDFYGPRDCIFGFGGMILKTDSGASAIALVRGKAQGPCGEREKSLLQPLLPHLRRAALLQAELASLRARRSGESSSS